jgi:riboflavin synthase
MFTGIVEAVGQVRHVQALSGAARIVIGRGQLVLDDVGVGDSIAVNGCCLTVVQLEPDAFHVDVSQETLAVTTGFAHGEAVNLEKALRLSDRLGGHFVTGHVDGKAQVKRLEPVGENCLIEIEVPAGLERYLARKGSVTVHGVSLTVNQVEGHIFQVNLIPHTLHATTLKHLRVGSAVNIEIDLLARYLERLNVTDR